MQLHPGLLIALTLTGWAPSADAQTPARIPEGTKMLADIAYVADGHERQKLDLFLPEKSERPHPVIIWIHGGGWAAGDKSEGCPPLNAGFTKYGYAVANVNYRLSGDALFPAQIEDCKAAIRWLRAHAAEHNLDPRHFGVWGASAGGHLVALLGATGTTGEFDTGDNVEQSSTVQAVVDYFGPTDILQMDAHAPNDSRLVHNAPTSPESRLVGGPIQEEPHRSLAARVNPIRYLTREAPPYLIVHGDKDLLVPHHQSELLYAALTGLGVPARFHTIRGAGHGAGFGGKEIGEMVAAFFEYRLMDKRTAAADWPAAMASESPASAIPPPKDPGAQKHGARPAAQTGAQQRPTWEQILSREDADGDGRVTREEFKGPPPMFQRLDRNADGILTKEEFAAAPGRR